MSAQPQDSHEVDAFILPGQRPNVKWRIVRNICYWAAAMLVDEREASYTSLAARPEPGDPMLRKIERRYFHEPD